MVAKPRNDKWVDSLKREIQEDDTRKKREKTSLDWSVWDGGHSEFKYGKWGKDTLHDTYPHALKTINANQIESYASETGDSTRSSIFSYSTTKKKQSFEGSFIVGDLAEIRGADRKRSGLEKLTRDYFMPLMLKGLIELYPQGNTNLGVMIAIAPIFNTETYKKSHIEPMVLGKHFVTLPSGKVLEYIIHQVRTFEEPVGGIRNWLFSADGSQYRQSSIRMNDRILVVDIGGKISTLTLCLGSGYVDYSSLNQPDLGIQDVQRSLAGNILSDKSLKKYFSHLRSNTLDFDISLRNAVRYGMYETMGYELDVTPHLADATKRICNELKSIYDGEFGSGQQAQHIVITGGGGGMLRYALQEHVFKNFNPVRIHLALPRGDNENDEAYNARCDEQMIYCNWSGGNKTLMTQLEKV